jgi:hypothetical protein
MTSACQTFVDALNAVEPNDPELVTKLRAASDSVVNEPDTTPVFPHVFSLFERYPLGDFGTPGPLVHLLERYFPAYESDLLASINRKPTSHTVWMLNRILNAKIPEERRARLLAALDASQTYPQADSICRTEARRFYERQLEITG